MSWEETVTFASVARLGATNTATRNVACEVEPTKEAVKVTVLGSTTECVVTGNVAPVAPAGTNTFAGTEAIDGKLLDRATTAPPANAGPVNVTVPVAGVLPPTVSGFTDSEDSATGGGVTVRDAVAVVPNVAEMLARVDEVT